MDIKIGLIGGGYWGKNLIRDFFKLGVLHTICDINQDSLNKYKDIYENVKMTTNWNDIILNKEINAVCISLPAIMHYKFAKKALENNKNVFVEKPITLDILEAEELVKLAKERNLILMVGHLLQYHPAIIKIKELIKNDKIGKIKNIISNRLNLGKFRVAENVLWSFAPHDISVILSLCDNEFPDRIKCTGKDFITKDVHDITNTVLFYDKKDIYVNINVNWLNPYKEQKMVIIGEKGMLVFDDTQLKEKLTYFGPYIAWSSSVPTVPSSIKNEGINIDLDLSKSPLELECKHFIECCMNKTSVLTDGLEGLRVLKILKYSMESLNKNKEIKFHKDNYFCHKSAIIDNGALIGNNTKIWHFSHISTDCFIGDNCNIGQNVYIAPKSKIGNNCKVQNNVSIYSGIQCEDYVFLGPSCVLTNDINPRAQYSKNGKYMKTYIEKYATVGANATIVCGNRIGHHALVGAGAVVTKDVKPYAIVVGNPAKQIGEIDKFGNRKLY